MSSSLFILFIIVSLSMIISGRSLQSPDHLMPLLLASSVNNDSPTSSHSLSGQKPLLDVVEYIIKYVSTIKSSENFIDNIINRQKQVVDKLKILRFLKNCFQITNTIIKQEMDLASDVSFMKKGSLLSPVFTLEELQEAQKKIPHLLHVIEQRMGVLKTWMPPTMPFLSF